MQRLLLMISLFCINMILPASTGPGYLDPSFNTTGYVLTMLGDTAVIYGTVVQPDGKIVVVGSQTSSSVTSAIIARYTIDGILDTTFASPNGYTTVDISGASTSIAYCVAIQDDGKIVVSGGAVVSSENFIFIERFLPNGLLDTVGNGGSGFGPSMEGTGPGYVLGQFPGGGDQNAYGITIQAADQKIVITGQSGNNLVIARYTTAGLLDILIDLENVPFVEAIGYVIFNPLSTTCLGRSVAIDQNGNIVVCGQVTNGQGYIVIARYLTNGSVDTSFGPGNSGWNSQNPGPNSGGNFIGYGLGFQSTGNIVMAATDGTNALVLRFMSNGLFDNNFGIADQSCFYTTFGVNSAVAYGLAVLQDDTIVFGGTSDDTSELGLFAVIGKITADGSAFDTSFGESTGYTALQINYGDDCSGQSFAIQSNGQFLVGGFSYFGEIENQLMIVRYSGEPTAGCMDVTYNAMLHSQNAPGFSVDPTEPSGILIPTNLPKVTALYPANAGNVFVAATSSSGAQPATNLVQLNSAGQIITSPLNIGFFPVNDIIMNSMNEIVLVGCDTAGTNGIIQYLIVGTGVVDTPGMFSGGNDTVESLAASFLRVGQQTNGRYVAIGQSSANPANGIIVGYTPDLTLDDYTQATPFGNDFGDGISGYNILETAVLTDMLIDIDNNIYVAFQNNALGELPGAGDVCVAKFLSDGSGLDTTFYGGGILDTGLAVSTCALPYITFNATLSNLLIMVEELSTGNIFVSSWDITGEIAHTGGVIYQSTSLLSTPVLTKLQCDTNNNLVCSGYDDNDFFVIRCSADIIDTVNLDTTFAPYGICPGILRTTYNDNNPTDPTDLTAPYRISNTLGITTLGNVMFGGYEEITSSETVSMVGQVVGYTGDAVYTQVQRFPGQLFPGMINPYFGTDGTLEVPGDLTIHPESMNVVTAGNLSGNILIGVTNNSSSEIAGLHSNFSLNTTSFGVTGEGTTGITPTLPAALVNVRQIMTDHAGNIYVVGDNGSSAVVTKLSADGSTIIWSYQNDDMEYGLCVAEQASGRILIGGYNQNEDVTSGVIVAINPTTGDLDTSFNQGSDNQGYYYTGLYTAVTSLSIVNATDQILYSHAVYTDDTVRVGRLLENGYADTTFPAGSPTYIANTDDWTQIKMQQDVNGKIVLARIVSEDAASIGFGLSRYNADGSDDVVNVSIPVSGYIGYSVTLENILCLSDGTTLVIGSNYIGNNVVLAKLTADFALDPTFGTNGIFQSSVTTLNNTIMTNFYAVGISSVYPYDIVIAGDDGVNPYLVGIVSGLTSAVTAVPQSTTSWGPAGTLDTTFNFSSGEEIGFLDLTNEIRTNLGSPSSVGAMVLNPVDGSYFVLSDDGTNSYVIKFDADDIQNTVFGTDGVVTISGMSQANAMILAEDTNLYIAGNNSSFDGIFISMDSTFGTSNFELTSSSFYYNFAIVQQTNGRILVAGANSNGQAAITAYDCVNGSIDQTFADNGIYSFTDFGYFITTIALDDSDNIYFMVNDNNSQQAYTKKLSYDGTTILWTADSTLSSANGVFDRVIIDQQGNVVSATMSNGYNILINRYLYVDGTTLQGPLDLDFSATGISRPNINALLIDTTTPTGNIIIVGCDSGNDPNNIPFVARVLSDLSNLDTTFNTTGAYPGVQSIAVTDPTSGAGVWYTGFIGANGKITVGGYALINGDTDKAYLMRLYGDDFIDQFAPASLVAGIPGTINQNFAQGGQINFANLSQTLRNVTPKIVLPLPNGYQYVAFDNGILIRLTNGAILDESFGNNGFAANFLPSTPSSMIIDSNGCLVAVGTSDTAWIARYANDNSGTYDVTFNDGSPVMIGNSGTMALAVIQQTLGRLIVAGADQNAGLEVLWAFTNTGAIDVTFNANVTPGYYSDDISDYAVALLADEYDRLIFAYQIPFDAAGTAGVTRLTSSGELDINFGDGSSYPYSGSIAGAIGQVADPFQICLAFDAYGNIVIASQIYTGSFYEIAVVAYANGTGSSIVEEMYTISGLISPQLTDMIATADGKILISGNQESSNAFDSLIWIARVQDNGSSAYELDTTFAPDPAAIPGILQLQIFFDEDIQFRDCSSIALYGDGEIDILAFVNDGNNGYSYLLRAYNNPYTTQQAMCQYAQPIGTNDQTFGVTTNIGNGITFIAAGTLSRGVNQYAQAVALQDDQNIVVASNGQTTYEGSSDIMINMFDVDGLLNSSFNPSAVSPCLPGQAIVLDSYDNQYIQDMMTFSVNDINKAILVGYATSNALATSNSLLMQYILTPSAPGLDASFGGFSGDPFGVVVGDNLSQGYTIGRQSMGRIIVGGISGVGDTLQGLLQAYTSMGLLDQSFGANGYFSQGTTGIYTSAIDSQDRIVIAFSDGQGDIIVARILPDGSGLDTSFNAGDTPGTYVVSYMGTVDSNTNFKIAVDQSDTIFIVNALNTGTWLGFTIIDTTGNSAQSYGFDGSVFGGLTNFTITQLLTTQDVQFDNNYVVFVGYDQTQTNPELDEIVIGSFVNIGGIWQLNEGGFNQADTGGYLRYAIDNNGIQKTAGAIIHPDGRIIVAGSVTEIIG